MRLGRSALMLLGAAAYFQLGQDEDPPFTFRVMVVRAMWPGATAQEMQDQVAEKIEKRMQELRGSAPTETYTRPGDLVVDLTMGSGSTGVACLRTGRRFVGVERDPGFHASALERMQAEVRR